MEQVVTVRQISADGTAQVLHTRQSACSGDCHKCSGCGAQEQSMLLWAQNPIGAQVGDRVILEAKTGPVLAAAAVLYLVPLILFISGYLLGEHLWRKGPLTGLGAFVLALILVGMYDRLVLKKKKTVYTITGFARQA